MSIFPRTSAVGDKQLKILSFGLTDVGMRRDHNEDSYLVDDDLSLYVVADGMGGHLGGETASSLAVETIQEAVKEKTTAIGDVAFVGSPREHPAIRMLPQAIKMASAAIFERALEEPGLQGMGTTVTALAFFHGIVLCGHVGDSRAYRIRRDEIEQLSEDHSLVNEQVKSGILTEEQARVSRFKHVITRSVGFEREVEVDLYGAPVEEGDIYLLCSDGLSNMIANEEILEVVQDNFLRDVPRALVTLANERGGDDNITVVTACVNGDA